MSPRLLNTYTCDCPVNPAHKQSVIFGECSCCGEALILCREGCSERELWRALGLPDEPTNHGPYVVVDVPEAPDPDG